MKVSARAVSAVLLLGLAFASALAVPAKADLNGSLIGVKQATGAFLSADFESQNGNVETSVELIAGDQLVRFTTTPGSSVRPTPIGIFLIIEQSTFGNLSIEADCSGPAEMFRRGPQLSDASVIGMAVCFNSITSTSFTVSVDFTATATGDLERFSNHNVSLVSGLVFITQVNGEGRQAVASGSVSDGSQNFTPTPSFNGSIVREAGGRFVVEPVGLAP
jgi:hypothetical protein